MRILVAALIALSAQLAHAAPPGMTAEVDPQTSTVEESPVSSYRGQTLTADGIAVGLILASAGLEEETIGGLGVAVYLVGAPLVHLTKRGRGKRALASVAMRAGLPLLGVLIGDSIPRDCGKSPCMDVPPTGVMIGVLAGTVAASALDTIFLASGDAPKQAPRLAWTPVAGPTRDGFALGVAGQF